MNMIYDDYGNRVVAVGNEISVARAKQQWPKLINDIQKLHCNKPNSILKIYRRIAEHRILNKYIVDSILKSTEIPDLMKHEVDFDRYRAICLGNFEKNGYIQADPSSKTWINLKTGNKILLESGQYPAKAKSCGCSI